MAEFFCDRCDEPLYGAVCESVCVSCLMSIEGRDGARCRHCDVPMDEGDDGFDRKICEECQEELDMSELNLEDDPIFTASDEEFLRGPF